MYIVAMLFILAGYYLLFTTPSNPNLGAKEIFLRAILGMGFSIVGGGIILITKLVKFIKRYKSS